MKLNNFIFIDSVAIKPYLLSIIHERNSILIVSKASTFFKAKTFLKIGNKCTLYSKTQNHLLQKAVTSPKLQQHISQSQKTYLKK